MNKTAYDNRKLRAYLLGALTEEEMETFDELSFTDDEFAEELSASEKDLVDAYARGQLTGEELKSFENYYLASPLRRENVAFASAFQTFAEKEIAKTIGAPAAEKPKRRLAKIFAGWNIFRNFSYASQFGLAAAALLFMIIGGWLWSENRRLNLQASEDQIRRAEFPPRVDELQKQLQISQTEKTEAEKERDKLREERQRLEADLERSRKAQIFTAQKKETEQKPPPARSPQISTGAKESPPLKPALTIASIILAPSLRGDNDQISNLTILPKTDFVDARLGLEADEFAAYRVALVDPSNQTLWQSGKIKTKRSADGKTLTVRFPAKNLKPQIYSLVVSGIGANGVTEQISSYSFRVVQN